MKGRARTKLGERDFRHPKETLILLTVGTNAKIGRGVSWEAGRNDENGMQDYKHTTSVAC